MMMCSIFLLTLCQFNYAFSLLTMFYLKKKNSKVLRCDMNYEPESILKLFSALYSTLQVSVIINEIS